MHFYSLWFSGGFVGRHRWVEYAEKGRYNASQVPPEWHGWLHYITDHTGDEARSFSYSIWYLILRKHVLNKECIFSASDAKTTEIWHWAQAKLFRRGWWVYLPFQGTCPQSRAEKLDQVPTMGTHQALRHSFNTTLKLRNFLDICLPYSWINVLYHFEAFQICAHVSLEENSESFNFIILLMEPIMKCCLLSLLRKKVHIYIYIYMSNHDPSLSHRWCIVGYWNSSPPSLYVED